MPCRTLTVCAWRIRDPNTGKWRTLRYKTDEATIRERFAEFEPIPGSKEVREINHDAPGHGVLARGASERKD